MILYNCKSLLPQFAAWRITKFDRDLNVEASYEVSQGSPMLCTCPSWPRKQTCKHITMLEKFRWRDYVDTDWFFNADTDSFYRPIYGNSIEDFLQPELLVGSTPYPSDPAPVLSPGSEAAEAQSPSASAVSIKRRQIV